MEQEQEQQVISCCGFGCLSLSELEERKATWTASQVAVINIKSEASKTSYIKFNGLLHVVKISESIIKSQINCTLITIP